MYSSKTATILEPSNARKYLSWFSLLSPLWNSSLGLSKCDDSWFSHSTPKKKLQEFYLTNNIFKHIVTQDRYLLLRRYWKISAYLSWLIFSNQILLNSSLKLDVMKVRKTIRITIPLPHLLSLFVQNLFGSNYFDTGVAVSSYTLYVQKARLVKYGGPFLKVLGP